MYLGQGQRALVHLSNQSFCVKSDYAEYETEETENWTFLGCTMQLNPIGVHCKSMHFNTHTVEDYAVSMVGIRWDITL